MATLKDIAQEADVSIMTVSRALSGIHKEIRPSSIRRADKIRAIAKRINFRPSATARAMRTNKTKMIGVLIRSTTDMPQSTALNYETILGIYDYLEQAGYEMCLVHQADLGKRSRIFREQMLDGVIMLRHMGDQLADEIRNTFSTYIWADVNIDEPTRCVRRNEFHAGHLVGKAIAERGYKKVLWLVQAPYRKKVPHYSQVQRLAGLRQGLGDQLTDQLEVFWVTSAARQKLLQRLGQVNQELAIVSYNTQTAQIVLEMLTQQRLFPGQDVGVVCPDDCVTLRQIRSSLSRVSFDRVQLGREAARLLLDQLAGVESPSVSLSGQWIEGQSLPYRHKK